MRKHDELADPNSCLNRAGDDEMVFVLLGRDADAPGTVRDWILRRLRSSKSQLDSPEIAGAEEIARTMEEERGR